MRNSALDVDNGDLTLLNELKDESLEQPDSTQDPFKLFQKLKNKAPSIASLKKTSPSARRPVSLLRSSPGNGKSRPLEQVVPLLNHSPTPPERIWSFLPDDGVLRDVEEGQSSTPEQSARATTSAKNRAKAQAEKLRVRKSNKLRPAYSIIIGNNSPTILVFGDHHGAITQCPNLTPSSSATE